PPFTFLSGPRLRRPSLHRNLRSQRLLRRLDDVLAGPLAAGDLVVIRVHVDVFAHSLNLSSAPTPPMPASSDASSMNRILAAVCRAFTISSSASRSSAVRSAPGCDDDRSALFSVSGRPVMMSAS